MSNLVGLLPFIALALSRPGLTPEVRLLAMIVLLALFARRWDSSWRKKAVDEWFALAPAALLLTLLAWMVMPERGLPYAGWPMMAAGMVFLFLMPDSMEERLRGAAAFCLTWWASFALFLIWPGALAMHGVWKQAAALYPPYNPTNPLEPTIPEALIFPPDAAPAIFFNATLVVTFLLILVWAASRHSLQERLGGAVAVLAASILSTMMVGLSIYVWLALVIGLVFVLTPFPAQSWRIKLAYGALLAVLVSWAAHTLRNPFFLYTPLPVTEWFWRARELFSDAASAYPVGAAGPLSAFSWLVMLALGVVFWLQFARYMQERSVNEPIPLFLVLAVATIAGALLVKPWQFFAQPVLWLALGLCAPRWESRPASASEPFRWDAPLRAAPVGMAALTVLVGLAGVYGITKEWRVESQLRAACSTSFHGERLKRLEAAFRTDPRRGDAAAIYATEKILSHIRMNTTPSSEELMELEIALLIGARHGIVPVMGYKRLADFYLLQGNAQAALRVLGETTDRFPAVPILRELYADLLEILGRRDEALVQYQRCLIAQPTSVRLRRKIALASRALGRTREADLFEHSIRVLNPTLD